MNAPNAVSKYPSFEESIDAIEVSFQARLREAHKHHIIPSFETPVILAEWDQLDALQLRLTTISPTDPAFGSLGKLSTGETYYVLRHETFWAYFVHDKESNELVGLVVKRRDEDEGVLAELERLLRRFRDRGDQ